MRLKNRLADAFRLFGKLTLRKVFNVASLWFSYRVSRALGKAWHRGLPMALAFEPTTACNLRCPECPSGLRAFSRPTGHIDTDFFRKGLDRIADSLIYLTLYFQGEPYLHPGLFDMIAYASQKNIYTATSTNAHFLDDERARKTVESGLDRLVISIDGLTQKSYSAYRIGGKLDKVIEGTKRLVSWKKKLRSPVPHLIFQFLVVKPNEHEIPALYRLAKELGVDEVTLKTAQIYDYENGSPLIPEQERYARYRKGENGRYSIKNPLKNSCWRMWRSCVITWDGSVVPCCFDKDAKHRLGRLGENDDMAAIWRGAAYRNFRTRLLKGRKHIDICRNCTEGTKVFG